VREAHKAGGGGMSDDIESISIDPRYEKLRRLCLELSTEANIIDAPKDLMLYGVAWNFEHLYAERINKIFGVR
jgi:hypothetical protein